MDWLRVVGAVTVVEAVGCTLGLTVGLLIGWLLRFKYGPAVGLVVQAGWVYGAGLLLLEFVRRYELPDGLLWWMFLPFALAPLAIVAAVRGEMNKLSWTGTPFLIAGAIITLGIASHVFGVALWAPS